MIPYDEVVRLHQEALDKLRTHEMRRNTLEAQVTVYADLLNRWVVTAEPVNEADPWGLFAPPVASKGRGGARSPRGPDRKLRKRGQTKAVLRVMNVFSDQDLSLAEIVDAVGMDGFVIEPEACSKVLYRLRMAEMVHKAGHRYRITPKGTDPLAGLYDHEAAA